jgi:hypothetical protein
LEKYKAGLKIMKERMKSIIMMEVKEVRSVSNFFEIHFKKLLTILNKVALLFCYF